MARSGTARHGEVRHGLAGMVRQGVAWLGSAGHGKAKPDNKPGQATALFNQPKQ